VSVGIIIGFVLGGIKMNLTVISIIFAFVEFLRITDEKE